MEMSKIEPLKAQAENLKAGLASEGIEISKGKALEMVARQYGFDNWDTLCAVVIQSEKAKSEPTLADLEYVPMRAWVEQGPKTESYNIEVFEEEGLALLHDGQALTQFLAEYRNQFEKGLDSGALYLFGDGHVKSFTFRELLGLKPRVIAGKTHWALADGDTFIRFDEEPVLAGKFELTVPKVTRSIKGTELIALRSHDGSFYDHFAIVPPHLDVETLRAKISEGLSALKERDAAEEDLDKEFTETDVKALVERLGCLWVATPHEVGQNWDN
jgi:hypothetical protein